MRAALTAAVYSRSAAARAGLRELLTHEGAEAVPYLGGAPPPDVDLLVVDLVPGDTEGRALLDEADGAGLPVLVLVEELPRESVPAWGAASTGPASRSVVRGWLRRDSSESELLAAARAVAAGLTVLDPSLEVAQGPSSAEAPLTDREREVLGWLAAGLTNRAIALELGISEHTAKFHVGAVLAKLGAQSRTEAVATAVRTGLLSL